MRVSKNRVEVIGRLGDLAPALGRPAAGSNDEVDQSLLAAW